MHSVPPERLSAALAEASSALDRVPAGPEGLQDAVRTLRDRLRRELLPRLAADAPLLLAAIVGPNNVGKSTLFNALARADLSPARAEGGLTRQCLAAAHPDTAAGAGRDALALRFEVLDVPDGTLAPVDAPGPVGRLYLARARALPPGLLILDTPDFDSVVEENRIRTEALLVTADVLLFVVSRHSYQNAALVRFLRAAVGRGRPYLLVYNEAPEFPVVRGHLEKLAADVGEPPFARYACAHDPRVEASASALVPVPLDGAAPLAQLLADPACGAELRRRARAASSADAVAELCAVAEGARAAVVDADRLRARLRHELLAAGARAALRAVPADVLVEAFRDELDARSRVHRWVRFPFRGLATAVTFLGRRLRSSFTGGPGGSEGPAPAAAVESTLRDGVRQVVDALAPEVAAWRGDAATRALLEGATGEDALSALRSPAPLAPLEPGLDERMQLYAFCRALVRAELPGGIEEGALQTLATLVYSVPASTAALVTVVTGGIGQDAVVWAGTLLTTPLMERFVDLLGSGIRRDVTDRWSASHGAKLARALEARLFQPLLAHLDARVEGAFATAATLTTAAELLAREAR